MLEAAVVGQPDPELGEQPVAFVVLRIDKALPRNAIGKVDKQALRQRLHGQPPAGGKIHRE